MKINLKNLARGSGKFHYHRLEILRDILDTDGSDFDTLSDYLRGRLFGLDQATFSIFGFGPKDWPLCERLLACRSPAVEAALLSMVVDYAAANDDSVQRLCRLSTAMSRRLLSETNIELQPDEETLRPLEARSLLSVRTQCASNQASTDTMYERLQWLLSQGWARSRLIYPLVYHFSHKPPAEALDSFLSYIVTGKEHDAEKLALKLILSDEAARDTSLSFKIYIGLMAHPSDAIEIAIDHVEFEIARGDPLPGHLAEFLSTIAARIPHPRARSLLALLEGDTVFITGSRPTGLVEHFGMGEREAVRYTSLCDMLPVPDAEDMPAATRPFDILTNMRTHPYPVPLQFQLITSERAVWFFLDAGRLIGAFLRSIYMIERAAKDLEARDALRLLYLFRFVNPFIASAPSAMFMIRALAANRPNIKVDPVAVERATGAAIEENTPFRNRLWINELQWSLRQLEEQGRIAEWLWHVRAETKLRPSYLTGINWHWVEQIISLQRLKPFRSFDGAYLFIHMELEANADPLRLRIVLEPLIRSLGYRDVVERIIAEFGVAAQVIVRRYLTTQNMLASGLAANYVAALDQRVRALEACIRAFGFGPLLTEDMYDTEVKALTAELLLTNVNAGKFEVPWDTFRKDANENHQDLYLAVESLRPRLDDEGLTAFVETPISFPNGRTQTYRVRNRDTPLFGLVVAVITGYMQHPAFGLEVILSGRFRHNHLLHELWSAMADVKAATIPSVTGVVQQILIEDYRVAAEQVIDGWCASRIQSRRGEKPLGLFDLVPEGKDVDRLLNATASAGSMVDVIDRVVDWIKERLRVQVAEAREAFALDVGAMLSSRFEEIKERQLESEEYREQDVGKVHVAITDAVLRRVELLRNWFDGVDATRTGSISFTDLSIATEALFESVLPDRGLKVSLAPSLVEVTFGPAEVKVAFDMLREIYFNALRHGEGPDVELTIGPEQSDAGPVLVFENLSAADDGEAQFEKRIGGSRYQGRNDALTREGNSGLAKIAASAATLIGQDVTVTCARSGKRYRILIPIKDGPIR